MYKELTDKEKAVGETVASITYGSNGQMIVAFEGETFIAFGDDILCHELDLEEFGQDELVASGILSRDEMFMLKEIAEERRQAREDVERRQYERLKAKFEA